MKMRLIMRTLYVDLELDSASGAWPQLHRGCLQAIIYLSCYVKNINIGFWAPRV